MSNPIPRVILPVERRALHVDILVRRVEIHGADGGRGVGYRVCDGHGGEEGRRDEVHVLPRVGE